MDVNPTTSRSQAPLKPIADEENLLHLLAQFWRIIKRHWRWFLASMIIGGIVAQIYIKMQPYVFRRAATVLIETESPGYGSYKGSNSMNALLELNGVTIDNALTNEVFIIQSHRLMERVVERLQLNTSYDMKKNMRPTSLYTERPFTAVFLAANDLRCTFNVAILSQTEYEVSRFWVNGHSYDFKHRARFGETIKTPAGKFVLTPEAGRLAHFVGDDITVSYMPTAAAAIRYKASISASQQSEEGTLISLSCVDTHANRADSLLLTLVDEYKKDIIGSKNRMAENTLNFIEQRIKIVGDDLNAVESQLARFKESHKVVDFKTNASTFINEAANARSLTNKLQAEVSVAHMVLDFLRKASNGNELIPTIGEFSAGATNQINRYNDLMTQRNNLADNSSETSPLIVDYDKTLASMRKTIISSVQNAVHAKEIELNKAIAIENSMTGLISSVPSKEKDALDIERQQAIKNTLYTYLLNKREQVALQLAVNEANMRLVEAPYGIAKPIAPRSSVILLVGLLIGFVLPAIYFILRQLFDNKVRSRRDIENYSSVPIIGDIPLWTKAEDKAIIDAANNASPIAEAFRMLRYNLGFMKKHSQVLLFTSATPAQGKSFLSRNLAVVLAMNNKRVLLIDADLRKMTQSKLIANSIGLTSYLNEDEDNIDTLIIKDEPTQGVDFLPAGMLPPNPAELLMNGRMEMLLTSLRQHYDHIIIDSTPSVSVADAGILAQMVDATLYVMRIGKQERVFLPEFQRLVDDGHLGSHVRIILNACSGEYGYYGYGYRYGYGYGYGYGDTHDKQNESLGGFMRHITKYLRK